MDETDTQPEDLLHELKVRRLVENQTRLSIGMIAGFPTAMMLEEGVRILAGGKSFGFILWMAAIGIVVSAVCLRFVRGWTEQSTRRQLRRSSKRLKKWLDKPGSSAVLFASMMGGFIAYMLFFSILMGDLGPTMLLMSSGFAFALIWGGLRWRTGDDLVCARCDYNKTPESDDICPECGSAWVIADTLALGRPAVVPWMIVAGAIAIGIDLTMVALIK